MDDSIDAQFTTAAIAASVAAEAVTEVTVLRLDVAGVRIDLRFASHQLFDVLAPALAHLEVVGETAADATVRLWDMAETGIPAPPPPVTRDKFTDRGDLVGLDDPGYRVAFHWSEYSVCAMDVASGEAAYWVADPVNLPYWAKSSPLRTILGWVLDAHGIQLVHAAAVATPEGAVLIVGEGGSGKSTTSLTCLDAGMGFLGDDYVAVTADPPTVYSLFATAKIADLTHPAAQRYPLMPREPEDEKAVLLLHPAGYTQLLRSAPLRAVVTPEVVDSETTDVVEIDRDVLEHAAAFTTLVQIPHAGTESRARIRRVLDSVPGGLLRLGRHRAGVVDAIRGLAGNAILSAGSAQPEELPSVTAVIPVHNGAHFLAEAVESLLVQHYPRLEIVVVNDGSVDDLTEVIAALPVHVRVHHQAQAGPAAARNRGISLATTDLVGFLDVDDTWPPGALHTLVRAWLSGHAPVVIGRGQIVELNRETGEKKPIVSPENAYPYYIGSALYERGVFDRVGVFDPEMTYGEDTEWFARLQEAGEELHRIPAVTLVVLRHGGNMTEGRSLVELFMVRAVKKSLDRKRNRERAP